jgi:hypothetical protein
MHLEFPLPTLNLSWGSLLDTEGFQVIYNLAPVLDPEIYSWNRPINSQGERAEILESVRLESDFLQVAAQLKMSCMMCTVWLAFDSYLGNSSNYY